MDSSILGIINKCDSKLIIYMKCTNYLQALETLFTCYPPAPDALINSNLISLSSTLKS